jgi:S-adenosylmethionine decarboxylase
MFEVKAYKDYFRKDPHGTEYAGDHILLDIWGSPHLANLRRLETALITACVRAQAKIIAKKFHRFGEGGGVSGVVILAESHISIHTWPERRYAAIDVFMCGAARPFDAVDSIIEALTPQSSRTSTFRRGYLLPNPTKDD